MTIRRGAGCVQWIGLCALTLWSGPWARALTPLSEYYGFGPMEVLKLDWDLGLPAAGDLNGDGLTDIVVSNNRKARLELLLRRPDTGPVQADLDPGDQENVNDVFGREKNWRFRRVTYPLSVQVAGVVVADLNGDKALDLAYTCREGLRLALQEVPGSKAETGPREPRWLPEQRWDIPDGTQNVDALAAGDLNGDGRTDLVLAADSGYYLLLQDQEGVLGKPVRQSGSSPGLRQVSLGDLNADGRCDLLLWTVGDRESPVQVRLQRPDGTLGPEQHHAIPDPSVVTLCRIQGRDRLVSVSRQSQRLAIYALQSEAGLEDRVSVYPLAESKDADRRAFAAGDVDADGVIDVVVSNPEKAEFAVYRGQGDGGFASPQVFPGLKDMRKICASRLTESGPESLIVLSGEEKLLGLTRYENGRLAFPRTVPVTGEPLVFDVADLNGDGAPDLAYVSKAGHEGRDRFTLRTVLGLGRAQAEPGPSVDLDDVKDRPQDLIACDIDQDGLADLIVVRDFAPLLLIRQTASGVFAVQVQDQIQSGLVSQLRPQALSVAALGTPSRNVLLLAQGAFVRSVRFDSRTGWQIVDQYQAADPRSQLTLAAALPDQGRAQVRIVGLDDQSGVLTFLDPQTDGTYRAGRQVKVPASGARRILGAGAGSGSAQGLVVCCDQKLVVIRSGAHGEAFRQIAGFEPDIQDGRFGRLDAGDLNGDGVPEVVLCEQGRSHIQILAFNQDGQLGSGFTFKVFEEHRSVEEGRAEGRRAEAGQPRAVLVRDFTGDGKNDLVVLVHDRLIVYPQE